MKRIDKRLSNLEKKSDPSNKLEGFKVYTELTEGEKKKGYKQVLISESISSNGFTMQIYEPMDPAHYKRVLKEEKILESDHIKREYELIKID